MKIWFQNRRTKWKKQENISNAEAAEHKIGGPKNGEAPKETKGKSAVSVEATKATDTPTDTTDSPNAATEMKHVDCEMDKDQMKSDRDASPCDTSVECAGNAQIVLTGQSTASSLTVSGVVSDSGSAEAHLPTEPTAPPEGASQGPLASSSPITVFSNSDPDRPLPLIVPRSPNSPPHLTLSYQESVENSRYSTTSPSISDIDNSHAPVKQENSNPVLSGASWDWSWGEMETSPPKLTSPQAKTL